MKNKTGLIAWLTIVWLIVALVMDALGILFIPWYLIWGPSFLMLAATIAVIINTRKL